MATCYIAIDQYEEQVNILGVFLSKADAEECCLANLEYNEYVEFLQLLMYEAPREALANAAERIERYYRDSYYVETAQLVE